MNIPWKRLTRAAWDAAIALIRATAPSKAQADPPPAPTDAEAWDRWKDGAKLVLLGCVLGSVPLAAQAPDAACLARARVATDSLARLHLASTVLTQYQLRNLRALDSLHATRCTLARVDTVPPPVVADSSPTPTVPVDSTPTPPPPPPVVPGPASAGVELPRAVPTWPAALETAACTQTIAAGLQAAINAARDGDVLCLTGTFMGGVRLPARTDSGWVVIRSAQEPTPPGTRQRPSQAGALARIQGTGVTPTLSITGAGWYLRSLDVAAESTTTVVSTIVDITGSRVVLDRVWVHPPVDRSIQRCVAGNGAAIAVVHSWLGECHGKGFDSQAFWSYNGTGPFLLDNNTLEGAGENVMFGGSDPRVPGLIPSDITITRNHVVTPLAWKGRWTKKNLFEIKNAQRVLVQGNVFEGSWTDAQTGFAFILKVANQSGGCRWCTMADVTVRENLIVRVGAVFGVTAKDPGVVDSLGRRLLIERNYADSVNTGPYLGASQLVALMNDLRELTVRGNTLLGTVKNDLVVATNPAATGLVFADNVLARATYPLHGCGAPILGCLPGAQLTGNVFVGAAIPGAPPGITTSPTLAGALASGAGISRATIDAVVRGVVQQP